MIDVFCLFFHPGHAFFIRTEIMWNEQAQRKHRTPLSLIGYIEGNKFINTW